MIGCQVTSRLFKMSLSFLFQAFVVDRTNSSVIRSSIAVAVVVVTVTDGNDNGPVFLSSEYTASVSESAQTGHIVLTSVEATDVDLVRSRAFQTIIAFLLCQLKKGMVLHRLYSQKIGQLVDCAKGQK